MGPDPLKPRGPLSQASWEIQDLAPCIYHLAVHFEQRAMDCLGEGGRDVVGPVHARAGWSRAPTMWALVPGETTWPQWLMATELLYSAQGLLPFEPMAPQGPWDLCGAGRLNGLPVRSISRTWSSWGIAGLGKSMASATRRSRSGCDFSKSMVRKTWEKSHIESHIKKKGVRALCPNPLISLVSGEGIEPSTYGLRVRCSA